MSIWKRSKRKDSNNEEEDYLRFYDYSKNSVIDYSDLSGIPDESEDDEDQEEEVPVIEFERVDLSLDYAHDKEGNVVECYLCGTEMIVEGPSRYVCPNCDNVMTREEFLNNIGIGPGEEEYDDYYRWP